MSPAEMVQLAKRQGLVQWHKSNVVELVYMHGSQIWAKGAMNKPHPVILCPEYYCSEIKVSDMVSLDTILKLVNGP